MHDIVGRLVLDEHVGAADGVGLGVVVLTIKGKMSIGV